jgi:hypothetical protein
LPLLTFKTHRFFLPVIVFIALSGLVTGSARAQTSVALQISPSITEANLDPGETASFDNFEIFNPSDSTEEVNLVIKDIEIKDERGTIALTDEANLRYSLSQWATVEPNKIELEPREHLGLEIVLAVPENAEPGGHYGAVFAISRGRGEIEAGDVGLGISAGVASPILLTVSGAVSTTGEIVELRKVPFINLGPVDFLIRFRNTGTVHYRPHGVIDIYDLFGNKAATVPVDEQRAFPETVRQLDARWNRILLMGKYRAVAKIFFGLEDERQDTAEVEFWAFPYKGLLGIVGVVIALILLSQLRRWWQERG